jgi:predicted nucleic acid-binding protein
MPAVILDACGIVNLYASGQFVPILTALSNEWRIPAVVEKESQRYRQPDPDDPEKLIIAPIDLLPAITGGVLVRCDCESAEETELYVQLAARIGDDGESMGLAIAKCRGWSVMTDDKKARKIATELGVAVVATTEIMKQWSEIVKPSAEELCAVLDAIERFANFTPARGAVNFDWWVASTKPNRK